MDNIFNRRWHHVGIPLVKPASISRTTTRTLSGLQVCQSKWIAISAWCLLGKAYIYMFLMTLTQYTIILSSTKEVLKNCNSFCLGVKFNTCYGQKWNVIIIRYKGLKISTLVLLIFSLVKGCIYLGRYYKIVYGFLLWTEISSQGQKRILRSKLKKIRGQLYIRWRNNFINLKCAW